MVRHIAVAMVSTSEIFSRSDVPGNGIEMRLFKKPYDLVEALRIDCKHYGWTIVNSDRIGDPKIDEPEQLLYMFIRWKSGQLGLCNEDGTKDCELYWSAEETKFL